jgi:hypothetical protein
MPRDPLPLDFPEIDPETRRWAYIIEPWKPTTAKEGDIASLKLCEVAPYAARTVDLATPQGVVDRYVMAWGFPKGCEDQGRISEGRFVGQLFGGLAQVQVDATGVGFHMDKGFSGTPIWHPQSRQVIGMAAFKEQAGGKRAAYFIPADLLLNALPPEGSDQGTPPLPRVFFHPYWWTFLKVGKSITMSDPSSQDVIKLLRRELVRSCALVSKESQITDWQPLIDSTSSFCTYVSSSQVSEALLKEYCSLSVEIVQKLVKELHKKRHLVVVVEQLEELVRQLRR